MQPAQEDVLTLSHTLDKLLARDSIQVELIPEKKGLFLKHVEYQVTSQASNPETRSPHKHSQRPAPFLSQRCSIAKPSDASMQNKAEKTQNYVANSHL